MDIPESQPMDNYMYSSEDEVEESSLTVDEGDGADPSESTQAYLNVEVIQQLGYREKIGINGRDVTLNINKNLYSLTITKVTECQEDTETQSAGDLQERYVQLDREQCAAIQDDQDNLVKCIEQMDNGTAIEYRSDLGKKVHFVFEEGETMCHIRRYFWRMRRWCMTSFGVVLYPQEAQRVMEIVRMALPFLKTPNRVVLLNKKTPPTPGRSESVDRSDVVSEAGSSEASEPILRPLRPTTPILPMKRAATPQPNFFLGPIRDASGPVRDASPSKQPQSAPKRPRVIAVHVENFDLRK